MSAGMMRGQCRVDQMCGGRTVTRTRTAIIGLAMSQAFSKKGSSLGPQHLGPSVGPDEAPALPELVGMGRQVVAPPHQVLGQLPGDGHAWR